MRRQRSLSPIRRPRSPSPRGRSRRRSISRSTRSYSSRSSYSSYTRSSISRGRSRSFSRSTRSSYSRSRSRDRPRFRGRPRSFSRSPRRRSFSPRSRSPRRRVYSRSPSPEKPPRYSLYISNLSYNVNKENLGEILEKYSKVKQIDLPVNNIKFQKSICAIVEFETAADADKARKTFDGSIIDGLTVKFEQKRKEDLFLAEAEEEEEDITALEEEAALLQEEEAKVLQEEEAKVLQEEGVQVAHLIERDPHIAAHQEESQLSEDNKVN